MTIYNGPYLRFIKIKGDKTLYIGIDMRNLIDLVLQKVFGQLAWKTNLTTAIPKRLKTPSLSIGMKQIQCLILP